MATRTSRTLNVAAGEQMRISAAAMTSMAPPMHHPSTAAITGLAQVASEVTASWRSLICRRKPSRSFASVPPALSNGAKTGAMAGRSRP